MRMPTRLDNLAAGERLIALREGDFADALEPAADANRRCPLGSAGVIDSLAESFAIRIDNLAAGERLIAVREADFADASEPAADANRRCPLGPRE